MVRRAKQLELEEYSRQEADAVLEGERLLEPEQVMRRWGISREQLKKLQAGRNRQGRRLPYIRIGARTTRFRIKDVLAFELTWLR